MDVKQFWALNEGLSRENAARTLEQRLMQLQPAEIADYRRISIVRSPPRISGCCGPRPTSSKVVARTTDSWIFGTG